jgi:membrane protein implicated in regulation of membrane protease activity
VVRTWSRHSVALVALAVVVLAVLVAAGGAVLVTPSRQAGAAPSPQVGTLGVDATRQHTRSLQVVNVSLNGSGPWTSWFGAPPQRTLALTVHNPSSVSYRRLPLVLHGAQTSVSSLGSLGAHRTRVYDIVVTFSAFSIGGHALAGTVGTADASDGFTVASRFFPWGLLVVVLVVLEFLLMYLIRDVREQRRRREGREGEGREGEAREGEAREGEAREGEQGLVGEDDRGDDRGPDAPREDGPPAVGATVGAAAAADGAPPPPAGGEAGRPGPEHRRR